MPWPLVPPDADFPSPIRRNPGDEWFAGRVEMTGMDPPTDQPSMRFSVGGQTASVWLPVERMGAHQYAGVVISRFAASALEGHWLENGGVKKSYPMPLKTVSGQTFQVRASASVRNGQAHFAVVGTGSGTAPHAVVAPFTDAMPKLSTMSEYQALGGWAPLVSGKATVVVAQNSGIKTYAVFIALSVPSKMLPASAVVLVTV